MNADPRAEHRAYHAAYVRHVVSAVRCACATGGLCERGRELEINASAAAWRWEHAERQPQVAGSRV